MLFLPLGGNGGGGSGGGDAESSYSESIDVCCVIPSLRGCTGDSDSFVPPSGTFMLPD